MQPELALKVISYSSVGLLLGALLFLLLVGLRRENAEPLSGIVQLGVFLMGLFAFVALMTGYFQARKMIVPQRNSQTLDTAAKSQLHGSDHAPRPAEDDMKMTETLVAVALVGIALLVCFFTAILLSYIYDMEQALLTF